MKAMILAAGHGTRMRPLTDYTPKPLLEVAGKALIVWHIEKLAAAGYRDIVINIAWLGDQIPRALGNGARWGINLHYSDEQEEDALETAGGIIKALPLLGEEPFLVVNGDVWCDHAFAPYPLAAGDLAHLILVNNPVHNPAGDFAVKNGRVSATGEARYTFSGIGYYHPALFHGFEYGKRPLLPVLLAAMAKQQVSGALYQGVWQDVGTPQRLTELNQSFA